MERGWQRKKEGEREEGKINRGLGEAKRSLEKHIEKSQRGLKREKQRPEPEKARLLWYFLG